MLKNALLAVASALLAVALFILASRALDRFPAAHGDSRYEMIPLQNERIWVLYAFDRQTGKLYMIRGASWTEVEDWPPTGEANPEVR